MSHTESSFWLSIQIDQSKLFPSQGLLDLLLGCILPHLQKQMVLRDFRLFKNNQERLKNAKEKIQKKKSDSVTSEKNSNFRVYLPLILGLSTTIFGFSIFGSSLAGFSIFGSAFWGGGTVFGTAYFADSLFGNAYFGRSLFGSRNGVFLENTQVVFISVTILRQYMTHVTQKTSKKYTVRLKSIPKLSTVYFNIRSISLSNSSRDPYMILVGSRYYFSAMKTPTWFPLIILK